MLWIRKKELHGWTTDSEPSEAMLRSFESQGCRVWVLGSFTRQAEAFLRENLERRSTVESALRSLREKHDGHYGIAVYDGNADKFVVVSDPYAIVKFYVYTDADVTYVGTRLSELAAAVPSREIHDEAFAYFLLRGFTPARHTFWKSIDKLEPGKIDLWDRGIRSTQDYLELLPVDNPISADEYLVWFSQHLRSKLEGWANQFKYHVLGVSGGIDSSIMVALMQTLDIPRDNIRLVTAQYVARDLCPDNLQDVHNSRRLAVHYGLHHDVVPYDLSDDRVLDDLLTSAAFLGSESSFGLSFHKFFDLAGDDDSSCYAGQNADSVLSFGTVGHPTLTRSAPYLLGAGAWVQRYWSFNGYQKPAGIERPVVNALFDRYMRQQYGVSRTTITAKQFLLGHSVHPQHWPFFAEDPVFAKWLSPERVGEWFWDVYVKPLAPVFASNQHSVFEYLYALTFMQGSDNRATVAGAIAHNTHVILPFASLEMLRMTTRLDGDRRFYWHGKYPNVHLASTLKNFPSFVSNIPPAPASSHIVFREIFNGRRMREWVHHLLSNMEAERFGTCLRPQYANNAYWTEQARCYENGEKAKMDPLYPKMIWFRSVEELAQPGNSMQPLTRNRSEIAN